MDDLAMTPAAPADLVSRLEEIADCEAKLSPVVKLRDDDIATVREAAQQLRALTAERDAMRERIVKYRAKLEVDSHFVWDDAKKEMVRVDLPFDEDEPMDGIDCRNETIKLQDERIKGLEQTVAYLKAPGAQPHNAGHQP